MERSVRFAHPKWERILPTIRLDFATPDQTNLNLARDDRGTNAPSNPDRGPTRPLADGGLAPGTRADLAQVNLRWLGLDWDEGPDVGRPSAPYVQSERMAAYERCLERLKRSESVYPCTCTRADIARAASAPHPEDEGPVYPGLCAGRSVADAATLGDRLFAWRFRVPPRSIAWDDRVLGRIEINLARLGGDFVVGRASVGPSYQLAVVHDDATMGVTRRDPEGRRDHPAGRPGRSRGSRRLRAPLRLPHDLPELRRPCGTLPRRGRFPLHQRPVKLPRTAQNI